MTDQPHTSPIGKRTAQKNHPVKRNTFIFSILMFILQVGISAIYGTLIQIPTAQFKVSSAIMMILLAILVIAGFGLVFGYTRRLLWSGIGFTFFITALCIELYPLINNFWTKVGLQNQVTPYTNFDYANRKYNVVLSDRQATSSTSRSFYGHSLVNALKCALSLSIAFSSILGRAGQLEALIVTVFGSITFELNRMLIQRRHGLDNFGTYFIFTFGGFFGLGLGFFLYLRQRKSENYYSKQSLKRYNASQTSALYSGIGTAIIFTLFPILAYQYDGYNQSNGYSSYTNPLCIILGLGAGGVGGLFVTTIINGIIVFRDLLHGIIAGGIVVGAASLYISNPIYAIVAGITGGVTQGIIQNLFERRAAKNRTIVSTVSWSLFGIQGLIGAAFASGWKAILYTSNHGLTVEQTVLGISNPQYDFYGGLISAGIGATSGLVIGLLIYLVNRNGENDFFEDFIYWYSNNYLNKQTMMISPIKKPDRRHQARSQTHEQHLSQKPQQPYDPYDPSEQQANYQFDFSEQTNKDINEYAYL